MTAELPAGEWGVLLNGWDAYEAPNGAVSGSAEVEGLSVLVVTAP